MNAPPDNLPNDPYDLDRFLQAQETRYEVVLSELRAGKKQSDWIWFSFPQVSGLGTSVLSARYAIRSSAEARAYLAHPVLGARLRECVTVLNAHAHRDAYQILGTLDARKLQSCLTLFTQVAGPERLFDQALEKYFAGRKDEATMRILACEIAPDGTQADRSR